MSDLLLAFNTIRTEQPGYSKASQYYEGTQPEVFSSPALRRALKGTSKDFRFNLCKTAVDSVLNRLEVTSVHATDTSADKALEEIFRYNEMDLEFNEDHRRALVNGDGYIFVWYEDNEDEDVNIIWNSPESTRIFYDPENPRKKLFAAKVWAEGEKKELRYRVTIYYADRIERWISKSSVKPKVDKDFYMVDDEPIVNEFGEVPIFHLRTERPYGRPEHSNGYGPQDMINKLVATQMAAADTQAFPQRVFLKYFESLQTSDNGDFAEFGENETKEPQLKLKGGPAEVWDMPAIFKDVKQFPAADPDAFLKPMKEYIKAFAATTETPIFRFDGMAGAPSGEALRVAEAPLVQKCMTRKQSFSATWQKVFEFALRLKGYNNVRVELDWAPIGTYDSLDTWETTALKIGLGLSKEAAFQEQGYNTEEVEVLEVVN